MSVQALTEAKSLLASKEYNQALEILNKAIVADATNKELILTRCETHLGLSDGESALRDAMTVVTQLDPQSADGYALKGLAEVALGQVLEAIRSFTAGLKIEAGNKRCQDGLRSLSNPSGEGAEMLCVQFMVQAAKKLDKDPECSKYAKEDVTYLPRLTEVAQQVVLNQDDARLAEILAGDDAPLKRGLAQLLSLDLPSDTPFGKIAQKLRAEQQKSASPLSPGTAEAKAEALKAQGNDAYKRRQFDEAARLYQEAFEMNPKEILYLNNLAAVYLEQGKYDECLQTTQKALDLRYEVKADFAKVAKVYNRRAACYVKMGDYFKAIESYKSSLVENNDRHTRAALRETEREYEKKQAEAYENPELAEQHRAKGNEHFKNREYPQAKAEYDEAIKRNPRDPKLYSNRAATYMCLLAYPDALKDAEQAIALDPKFVKAWARKAGCHYNMKEYHKALDAYNKGLEIDPNNAECQRGRINVLVATEKNNSTDQVDEEQIARAMADPEVQNIMRDPQMQMILGTLQSEPQRIMEYMQDPKIAAAIQKLMVCGILRTR